MTPHERRRAAQRRTVGRWIDDLIRSIERKAADPTLVRPAGRQVRPVQPPLRLRRDLNLVLGL